MKQIDIHLKQTKQNLAWNTEWYPFECKLTMQALAWNTEVDIHLNEQMTQPTVRMV